MNLLHPVARLRDRLQNHQVAHHPVHLRALLADLLQKSPSGPPSRPPSGPPGGPPSEKEEDDPVAEEAVEDLPEPVEEEVPEPVVEETVEEEPEPVVEETVEEEPEPVVEEEVEEVPEPVVEETVEEEPEPVVEVTAEEEPEPVVEVTAEPTLSAEAEQEMDRLNAEIARLRRSMAGAAEVIEDLESPPMPPAVLEDIVVPAFLVGDFARLARQLDRELLIRANMGTIAMLHPDKPGVMISTKHMTLLPRLDERGLCAAELGLWSAAWRS